MVGGRLGYVIFYRPEMLRDPLSILRVWEGGMSSHGGMLGLVFSRSIMRGNTRFPGPTWAIILCVVAPIGLFFGRCANFINGELYGRVCHRLRGRCNFRRNCSMPRMRAEADRALAPAGSRSAHESGSDRSSAAANESEDPKCLRGILTPRHPSQIYEALLEGVVLFAFSGSSGRG